MVSHLLVNYEHLSQELKRCPRSLALTYIWALGTALLLSSVIHLYHMVLYLQPIRVSPNSS